MSSDSEILFSDLTLDVRIKKAIKDLGWTHLTEIQKNGLSSALEGKNLLIRSKTGSGKTAIYLIAIIEKLLESIKDGNTFRSLIFGPSCELVHQISKFTEDLTKYTPLKVLNLNETSVTSSDSLSSFQILVGTPSKILNLFKTEILSDNESIKSTVFDEADLLFSFGHSDSLNQLASFLPSRTQSIVLSATLNDDVEQLCSVNLYNPLRIVASNEPFPDSCQLTQYLVKCELEDRFLILYSILILKLITGKVLIFCNSITNCYKTKLFLKIFSIDSIVLNPELPLNTRIKALEAFKINQTSILISVDDENQYEKSENNESSISRGLDFINVENIINFDFPQTISSYIHRVGRTARAHSIGLAFTFCSFEDKKMQTTLESFINENSDSKLMHFVFKLDQVERFRYRVDDAIRSITKSTIINARRQEIQSEISKSEKLMKYLKNKPETQLILKSKVQKSKKLMCQSKKLPEYLIPEHMKNSFCEDHDTFIPKSEKKKKYMDKKRTYQSSVRDPLRCSKAKRFAKFKKQELL